MSKFIFKGTPGPWKIDKSIAYIFIGDKGNRVCMVNHLEDSNPDHTANAAAIAEVPNMLELLADIVHGLNDRSKLSLWDQSVKQAAEEILHRIENQNP